MAVTLAIIAGIIFLLYSLYFVKIISGDAVEFEKELLAALADWMQNSKGKRPQIRLIFFISLIAELFYFLIVFLAISNPFIIIFTIMFAGIELYHILKVGINFHKFLKGTIKLINIFNWRLERISAMLFFTHSLLVLFSIFLF